MSSKRTRTVTVRLPVDLADRLDGLVVQLETRSPGEPPSRSALVTRALACWFREQGRKAKHARKRGKGEGP